MIEILALILLLLRVWATVYLVRVLKAQWKLGKLPVSKRFITLVDEQDIIKYRRQLFYLTLGLAMSNLLPIITDTSIFLEGIGVVWLNVPNTQLLIAYTISNAFSAVLAAFLIHKIYVNALEVDQSNEHSDHTLMNDE